MKQSNQLVHWRGQGGVVEIGSLEAALFSRWLQSEARKFIHNPLEHLGSPGMIDVSIPRHICKQLPGVVDLRAKACDQDVGRWHGVSPQQHQCGVKATTRGNAEHELPTVCRNQLDQLLQPRIIAQQSIVECGKNCPVKGTPYISTGYRLSGRAVGFNNWPHRIEIAAGMGRPRIIPGNVV